MRAGPAERRRERRGLGRPGARRALFPHGAERLRATGREAGGLQDGFTVALVRQSGVGDYFEQWGRGAQAQIEAAGGKVTSYDARGDNARQVSLFNDAIAAKPKVIIVDHGLADSVNPKIDEAINAGIPVVVYDVNIATARRPTSRRTTSRSPPRSSTT